MYVAPSPPPPKKKTRIIISHYGAAAHLSLEGYYCDIPVTYQNAAIRHKGARRFEICVEKCSVDTLTRVDSRLVFLLKKTKVQTQIFETVSSTGNGKVPIKRVK